MKEKQLTQADVDKKILATSWNNISKKGIARNSFIVNLKLLYKTCKLGVSNAHNSTSANMDSAPYWTQETQKNIKNFQLWINNSYRYLYLKYEQGGKALSKKETKELAARKEELQKYVNKNNTLLERWARHNLPPTTWHAIISQGNIAVLQAEEVKDTNPDSSIGSDKNTNTQTIEKLSTYERYSAFQPISQELNDLKDRVANQMTAIENKISSLRSEATPGCCGFFSYDPIADTKATRLRTMITNLGDTRTVEDFKRVLNDFINSTTYTELNEARGWFTQKFGGKTTCVKLIDALNEAVNEKVDESARLII